MNALRNSVKLIGRLGAQPEFVTFESGRSLVRFTLATNERYKDKSGQWKDLTQWHNINAWGKTAERIHKLVVKGQEIILDGRIVNQSYESKTGEKRYSTIIEVNDFVLISTTKSENTSESN